jgi:NAD(P)-dependent dehydrogenase (short-subunit alcohol dehydrogenase family)
MAEGNIRFDGRAIVVTGAGRGLGRAQALLLASRGASVVVSDNGTAKDGEDPSTGPAASVVAEIQAAGGKAVACTADLSTDEGATAAVQACLDAFGRIDGIAHYASSCPPLKSPDQLSTRDLELVMRINAGAAMWMARAAWPHMARAGYGRIVLTTSGGAYGARNNADYSSAKAAQIGLTRCLAVDGAEHGILVNAVAPSAHTRMTDGFFPGKFADWFAEIMAPEKVAASAAYLLSEECAITGETFAMGGGRIARIALAEGEGVVGVDLSIEEVREMMPRVMADTTFFKPRNLGERSLKVASILGFDPGQGD